MSVNDIDTDTFTIWYQGEASSGEVTFWKTPKGKCMYQCIGIGEPKRCSKKKYEEAKALYEEQTKERVKDNE